MAYINCPHVELRERSSIITARRRVYLAYIVLMSNLESVPQSLQPNQKFIVVATSRMIKIDWSSVDLRWRPSSAFQSFPTISNAGSAAFPMLTLVGNDRDSVL